MSASETFVEAVAERWLARVLESSPVTSRASLAASDDPFRNPAGHVFRESLRALAAEVLGEMNPSAVAEALDAVVRLRAVQNLSPSQALRFILDLRNATADMPGIDLRLRQERIDELALLAFDQYMCCREQIFELRMKELRLRGPAGVEP